MTVFYQTYQSPINIIYIAANDKYLLSIAMDGNWARIKKTLGKTINHSNSIIEQTKQQLDEYFKGKRYKFDLPILFSYGTAFQKSAWQALLDIPYGESRSYSQQAVAINKPKAVRAIGHSNSLNPISIVVPCHRVIAKSGNLAGYAGGLDMKRYLLELEGCLRME